jgi:predicted transcriptional regulator
MRSDRINLGITQIEVAIKSGVSRQKICGAEAGYLALSPEEQQRIYDVFQAEAERLRRLELIWTPNQDPKTMAPAA